MAVFECHVWCGGGLRYDAGWALDVCCCAVLCYTRRSIIKKSTADDLKWIIRIIDKDLRIKVGAKYVLGGAFPLFVCACVRAGAINSSRLVVLSCPTALHGEAFEAYRNSANLKEIVSKVLRHESLQDLTASQLLGAHTQLSLSSPRLAE
jgi:hypothetical protein